MEVNQQKTYEYDAFISYSRKDKAFAAKLERALENYKPPKDLRVPQRRLNIFRDEGDMTGTEYFQSIEEHLKNSAKLIVVCSPNARKSELVNDEIRRFVNISNADNVIPVLLYGIPNNLAEPGQEEELAFPEALCEIMEMPLATSFLGFRFRRDKINKGFFEASWYTILANIYAISRSEIEQRDKKRQTHQRKILSGITLGIMIALISLTGFALWQRDIAITERERAFAREVLALAEAKRYVNTECSLSLALKAYDIAKEIPNLNLLPFENVLRRSLAQSHVRLTLKKGFAKEFPRERHIDWNPDGQTVSVVAGDGTVQIWDAHTGERISSLPVKLSTAAAWHPTGEQLAIGLRNGTVKIWDTKSSEVKVTLLDLKLPVVKIGWSPNGKGLAASSRGTTRFWYPLTGQTIEIPTVGGLNVGFSWSPNGKKAAVIYDQQTILVVNPFKKTIGASLTGHTSNVIDLAANPNGRWLAAGSDDGQIYLWDMEKLNIVSVLGGHTSQVVSVVWNPDGQLLASASWDGTIRLWDFEFGRNNLIFGRNIATLTGHTAAIRQVIWSPDGQQLVSASEDGTIRFWDVYPKKSSFVIQKSKGWMWHTSWGPKGRLVASASDDHTIKLWDAVTGESYRTLVGHKGQVTYVAWSQDGKRLASASLDESVRIWDVASGKIVHTLSDHEGPVSSVVWSPDGEKVASTSPISQKVFLWNARNGEKISALNGIFRAGWRSLAWSPSGALAISNHPAPREISLWNVEAREFVKSKPVGYTEEATILDLAWSSDGSFLAWASGDGTAGIWDVRSGKNSIVLLKEHSNEVYGVAWSPDGKQLATASLDKTIRLWNVKNGKNLAILSGHTSGVRSVSWNPDGRQLVSAAEDGTVRLFFTRIEDLLLMARRQVAHGLTSEERDICLSPIL